MQTEINPQEAERIRDYIAPTWAEIAEVNRLIEKAKKENLESKPQQHQLFLKE